MNRIEFMTELAALLQDVPVEERREAMQYYNDYFDDAGEENEEQVISELGNPAKVAATIKADLGSQAGDYAEYSENGYTDSRFDQKEMPAGRDYQRKEEKEPPKTSRALKIVLIIAIILVGAPVLIPMHNCVVLRVYSAGNCIRGSSDCRNRGILCWNRYIDSGTCRRISAGRNRTDINGTGRDSNRSKRETLPGSIPGDL